MRYSFAFSQSSCCHELRCSARCKQCLPKLFSPRLGKSNLTETLIVLNPLSQALKHWNKYDTSMGRSVIDAQPYLLTRSVRLSPQGPKDYGTCGNGEYNPFLSLPLPEIQSSSEIIWFEMLKTDHGTEECVSLTKSKIGFLELS